MTTYNSKSAAVAPGTFWNQKLHCTQSRVADPQAVLQELTHLSTSLIEAAVFEARPEAFKLDKGLYYLKCPSRDSTHQHHPSRGVRLPLTPADENKE